MIYAANKVHGKQRKGSETRALKELAMCRLFQKEPVPEKFDMVFGCKLERQFCWTMLAGLIPPHSSSFLMIPHSGVANKGESFYSALREILRKLVRKSAIPQSR